MAAQNSKYYPQLPLEVHPAIKEEVRYVRDALYTLRNSSWDIREFTLTSDINFSANNLKPTVGRPIMLIFIQDGVGGHTVKFDSTIKGISTVVIDTTANTYSTILLYPKSEDVIYVMSGVTGGAL